MCERDKKTPLWVKCFLIFFTKNKKKTAPPRYSRNYCVIFFIKKKYFFGKINRGKCENFKLKLNEAKEEKKKSCQRKQT